MYASALAAYSSIPATLLERIMQPVGDGFSVGETFKSIAAGTAHDAAQWYDIHRQYYEKQLELDAHLVKRALGDAPQPVAVPDAGDRRFRAPEWREPYFDYLVQSYLIRSRWLTALVEQAELEPRAKKRLLFWTRQWIDAMSPANFLWSNPEALRHAAETGGQSLVRGWRNLVADLEKGLVSSSDEEVFEVGRNLAITPGAVVYQNDFFQLLQYHPSTAEVHERPLLIVPPCINKYYILDLQPENSFVRYCVEQGHTAFVMSWRNMPPEMGRATWDDYLEHGVLAALGTCAAIAGTEQVNALGFCVGGTLLASALAIERARGRDPAASLTLLAAMLDFEDTGELSVFVDESYVRRRELELGHGGLLHGRELALTFASLRANDLIWHYVVNNYLKGERPEPFDMLYWNADSTNLPGPMYVYYLRNMYLENNLRVPGRLTMCGVPVDLAKLDMPAYVLATREDHIVPWRTAYAGARLLSGDVAFVLGASGHIAGVVNPAWKNRRSYWHRDRLEVHADRWLEHAALQPGSWWTHWMSWLKRHGGKAVAARSKPGGAVLDEIEPAPGRYVKERPRPLHAAAAVRART